ncbi:MAG: alanine racemase [Candidatus Aminicenantes bacterium]|nr:alanine racemase [Candidatus Aminicenantes bacterium]
MKTRIEINREHLHHNLSLFHRISQKKIMFVVKANAYGHGLEQIVEITKDLSFIEYYAVDSLPEALMVKKITPVKNILVIGWADDQELIELIKNDFEIVVPSLDYFRRVRRICTKKSMTAHVHLKLDTGTSRLGMQVSEIIDIFNQQESSEIEIKGLYSHFANIEDTTDHSFARYQLGMFNDLIKKITNKRILRHFSCSASTLLFPETYFDIVRVGISAYGYWPSKQTYISYIEKNKKNIDLKPVLSWVSKVAQIRTIDKDKYIGYGLTYQTFSRSKMIVIPVGYYDGYDRKLSNLSNILVNGIKAPVRGRVCMNMMMAEVSHIRKIREEDRVLLIGSVKDEKIDADYLGNLIGTINYEILSRINPLIPRIIIN